MSTPSHPENTVSLSGSCAANRPSVWIAIGAICGGLAVIAGAFGAHLLGGGDGYFFQKYGETLHVGTKKPMWIKYLDDFHTAAEYQATHALALIAVGLCATQRRCRMLHAAGFAFLLGIVLFSGMLYVLALTGERWLGAIVPLGGVAYIVGWVLLAWGMCPCRK